MSQLVFQGGADDHLLDASGMDLPNTAILRCLAGKETPTGGASDDRLQGGAGNDLLRDGAGVDLACSGTGREVAALGDDDGDGRSDILWRQAATPGGPPTELIVWTMNGATILRAETLSVVSNDWQVA